MGITFTKPLARLFSNKEICILMIGLDASGKTTILHKLELGKVVTTFPTIGFGLETLEYRNTQFTSWALGGGLKLRPLWRHWFPGTQALIFVVDSNDLERIAEARDDLHSMLEEDGLSGTTLLVFANKQDLPDALNVADLTDKLGLHSICQRKWHVQPACARTGDGLYEGFDWLVNNIGSKKEGGAAWPMGL